MSKLDDLAKQHIQGAYDILVSTKIQVANHNNWAQGKNSERGPTCLLWLMHRVWIKQLEGEGLLKRKITDAMLSTASLEFGYACMMVRNIIGGGIIEWNDSSGRTKEEVISTLDQAIRSIKTNQTLAKEI